MIRGEEVALLRGQSGEAKHSDLLVDVPPVLGRPSFNKCVSQALPHLDNATSHRLNIVKPLLRQRFVLENGVDDIGPLNRRVGVHRPHEDLQLALDLSRLLGVVTHDAEGTHTVSVQAEVLCERLAECNLVSLLYKHTQRSSIDIRISRCEPLVCTVHNDKMTLFLANFRNILPFRKCWIRSGWIMSTHMHQHYATVRRIINILEHSIDIYAVGLAIIISVLLHLQTRVLHNWNVIPPSRVRYVNIGLGPARMIFVDEFATDSKSSSARKSLNSSYTTFI
mmetsp:Transcript_14764/g.20536  ORF Transcript_14764/g.20536 Transcript_14764/m.20536 type:complete len:280 (-) Transcript_14764:190-1029(-)